MGLPAARATDLQWCPAVEPTPHVGGPILPPCSPTVFITGQPAARVGDRAACSCATNAIVRGSGTVTINGKLAARMTDACVEGLIATGEPTVQIGGPSSKPSLEWILAEYQASSDKISLLSTDEHVFTKTEVGMIAKLQVTHGLIGVGKFVFTADGAFAVATEQYPSQLDSVEDPSVQMWLNNDGHRDAFRHAYWNAVGTKRFGEEWMAQYGTAHEGIDGNPAGREAMDLYNNEMGRLIAAHNPDASVEQLAVLIEQAVTRGELLVIDDNRNLAWSDQVSLWEHGEARNGAGVGKLPIPAGDASAR